MNRTLASGRAGARWEKRARRSWSAFTCLELLVLLALAACSTRQPLTKTPARSELQTQTLPHVFFIDHRGGPAREPLTRQELAADDAAALAAQLANQQCERQYRRQPFKPEQYRAVLEDGVYHWGKLDVGGVGGFSALVTFFGDGSKPHVEVYFSSDTLLN